MSDLPAQSENSSIASAKPYDDTFKKGSGTLIDTLEPAASQLLDDVLRQPSSIAPGAVVEISGLEEIAPRPTTERSSEIGGPSTGTFSGGTGGTVNDPATDLGFTLMLNGSDGPESGPQFISATTATAAEDVNDTTVLYTATATDADATATLTYSLTDDAGGRFEIDAGSGQVTLASGQNLDREAAASHGFTVQVSDGLHTATRSVTLAVTDVNEATPVFTSATTATAAEDVNDTTVLYTATATDADAAALTYSLTDDAGGRFEIDAGSGQVTLASGQSLDRESAASHGFTVQVSDGTNTASRSVTLAVTDVNEAPTVFTSGTSATAAEDVNDTAVLYTATATDADATAALTYSLTDDAGGLFEIDAASGQVTLSDAFYLDRETAASHSFTVQVSDGTNTASRSVTLAVTDVNEATPMFTSATTASAAEDVSDTTVLYTATATDADATAALSYTLTDDDNGRFEIDSATGQVTLASGQSLDREAAASHGFTVQVSDGVHTATRSVTLAVTDVNEATPVFTSATTATAAEDVNDTTVLYTATATDADATAALTYSLTDDAGGRFEIDAASGQVTLASGQSLDRESAASHGFTVQVSDGVHTATRSVTLAVTDVNEATPAFTSATTATAAEDVNDTTVLYTATATDADATAALTYSLTDDAGGRFEIDAGSGQVTLASGQSLDRESAASHGFTVEVSDGVHTASRSVTLAVTDVNEATPVFTSGTTATAAEDVSATAVLYTATATDADATAALTYSLTDDAGGRFEIDSASGQVTLAGGQSLDRESAASHGFTVQVSDGTNTATRSVTLAVTDVNEATPVFTSGTTATAAEDVSATAVLYTATATDADATAALTYSLTDNAGGRFEIDAASGQVTLASGQSLDRESAASHGFTVQVSDGVHTASRSVTLAVTDVNEATPVFTSGTTATAAEDVSATAVLYTATATDADATAALTYSLTDNAGGRFEIDAASGQVTLASGQSLDRESAASHGFTVQVSDGTNTATRSVTLAVTDVNEATPVFTSATTATAAEDVSDTAVLYTATATDADATAALTYSLTDDAGGRFEIDSASGQVTLAGGQSLDRESAASHGFTVQVSDGTNTATRSVTLAVTDVNEATPAFTSATTATAAEDVSDTAVLYTATATDADATASLSFSLTDDAGGRFEIDSASGQVTLASGQSLDREAAASHGFTVQVSDGTNTASRSVTLAVTDVNEAPPVFTSGTSATAAEDVSDTTVLYTATATDADATAALTYSLTDNDNGRFEIDSASGQVTLASGQSLDRESAASHGFTVQVSDGTNTATRSVTLAVTDVNEATPVFTSGTTATAAEDVSDTAVLYTATATDADATAALTYSLTDDAGGRFEIDSASGQVTLASGQSLDRESAASHGFTVQVSDGVHTASRTVTLAVTDVNEAPPVFTSGTSATAAEDVNATTVLYTATAADADATATLSYTLTDDDNGRFEIDATTGQVTLASGQSLDRESAASHGFTVQVSDGVHTASRTVTLAVTDVNEATPAFTSATTATAAEDVNATTVLYTATATDADATATLSYTLTDDDNGRFEIDSASGQVTLAGGQSLDRESAAGHGFTVQVSDGLHTATRSVTLAVTDVNEAPTAINYANAVTTIAENTSTAGGIKVADLSVTDDAIGTTTFAVTGADQSSFEIRNGSELYFIGASLNFETKSSYAINVTADDTAVGATPDVTRSFILAVTDVNEAPTAINYANAVTSIAENTSTAGGIKVADLSVTDDALGTTTFAVAGADASSFEIRNGSELYFIDASLNFEAKSSYAVNVTADDITVGATPDVTRSFTLAVTDVNEAPTAVSFANQVALAENASIGSGVKVADILISDDALGAETLGLTGADASAFEIRNGSELYFIGASPNFEAKASYAVNVTADDTTVGSTPDVTQDFTLNITDVNETPTAISFANQITLAENTSIGSGVKVADILISDDALGSETISLTGTDAGSFQVRNGSELYFIGASPNFEAKSSYSLTVNADDSTLGANPDVAQAFTLSVGNVNEAPVATNDTNAGDEVVEDARNLFGIVTFAGDPNATGNVLTNDTDPESDTLAVVGVAAGTPGSAPASGVGSAIVGTFGSLTVAASGTWNYLLNNTDSDTANLGQLGQPSTGTDVFTYSVSDGHGNVSTATVSITIQGSLDILA